MIWVSFSAQKDPGRGVASILGAHSVFVPKFAGAVSGNVHRLQES
ncbi:hypothetical protein [Streptosporangium sp. KLBMP 9127]